MLLAAKLMWCLALLAAVAACFGPYDLARGLAATPPPRRLKVSPHLVIAATGPLPSLECLRDALAAQTTAPVSLTFSIESPDDPACARVAEVFRMFGAPVHTVIAGLATSGAQKSHNLAEALLGITADRPVVLADADISPQPHWLSLLLRPILKGNADVVTGYRWPVPTDAQLPTLLASWIDRALAGLPKPVGARLIWGGSVALAPEVCRRIDLPAHLEREVSDDLVLAELARLHRLRVRFQNGVLLATPTRHGWRSLFGFGRRQYQMIRLYAPALYLVSLLTAVVNLLGTAAPLLVAFWHPWAVLAYAALVVLAVTANELRVRLSRASGIVHERSRAELGLRLLPLLLPIVHLVNVVLMVSAISTRTIRWGRFRYRLRGRKVVVIQPLFDW